MTRSVVVRLALLLLLAPAAARTVAVGALVRAELG